MAKAAVIEASTSMNFPFGKVQSDVKMKRKTPSELRGEQLKRKNCEFRVGAHYDNLLASDENNAGEMNVLKKSESRIPKYVNTRLNEVFPVKKSSERFRELYGKERSKESLKFSKISDSAIDSSATTSFPPKGLPSFPCEKADNFSGMKCSDSFAKESGDQGFRTIEKCSQSALRNVVELHMGNEKSSDSAEVDMKKALKGLVARDISSTTGSTDSDEINREFNSGSLKNTCTEFHIQGRKSPLDFTLKTTFRLVSSSSVQWCHRLSATHAVVGHVNSQFNCNTEQKFGRTNEANAMVDTMYTKALQSWIYPQSSLPASIISALTLSAAKGENDFLRKRQQDWEDSFRSIYYMLRKNLCNIFYVHTPQFVVLFIGGNFLGKKHTCSAYLSQSTSNLRSVLKKQDISFSMPLCRVEDEQVAEEDLIELAEIEKGKFGQTIHVDSMSDVDNRPQSLLAFIGNDNTHGLYNFLLNYRFFLNSLSGVDVPVLHAPVPFQNASLSIPEVKCREMKRADVGFPYNSTEVSHAPICYSIEIKDTILPPWVISGICAAMSSDGRSFESSFTTEPTSLGLNIAIDTIYQKSDCPKDSNSYDTLGIAETIPSPYLRSASLKTLKYFNGSYVAHLFQ